MPPAARFCRFCACRSTASPFLYRSFVSAVSAGSFHRSASQYTWNLRSAYLRCRLPPATYRTVRSAVYLFYLPAHRSTWISDFLPLPAGAFGCLPACRLPSLPFLLLPLDSACLPLPFTCLRSALRCRWVRSFCLPLGASY